MTQLTAPLGVDRKPRPPVVRLVLLTAVLAAAMSSGAVAPSQAQAADDDAYVARVCFVHGTVPGDLTLSAGTAVGSANVHIIKNMACVDPAAEQVKSPHEKLTKDLLDQLRRLDQRDDLDGPVALVGCSDSQTTAAAQPDLKAGLASGKAPGSQTLTRKDQLAAFDACAQAAGFSGPSSVKDMAGAMKDMIDVGPDGAVPGSAGGSCADSGPGHDSSAEKVSISGDASGSSSGGSTYVPSGHKPSGPGFMGTPRKPKTEPEGSEPGDYPGGGGGFVSATAVAETQQTASSGSSTSILTQGDALVDAWAEDADKWADWAEKMAAQARSDAMELAGTSREKEAAAYALAASLFAATAREAANRAQAAADAPWWSPDSTDSVQKASQAYEDAVSAAFSAAGAAELVRGWWFEDDDLVPLPVPKQKNQNHPAGPEPDARTVMCADLQRFVWECESAGWKTGPCQAYLDKLNGCDRTKMLSDPQQADPCSKPDADTTELAQAAWKACGMAVAHTVEGSDPCRTGASLSTLDPKLKACDPDLVRTENEDPCGAEPVPAATGPEQQDLCGRFPQLNGPKPPPCPVSDDERQPPPGPAPPTDVRGPAAPFDHRP